MGRVVCQAKKNGEVKRRGNPTVEWYAGEEAQYYCHGYIDKMTDEPLKTCKQCADFVSHAQEDCEKYKAGGENDYIQNSKAVQQRNRI